MSDRSNRRDFLLRSAALPAGMLGSATHSSAAVPQDDTGSDWKKPEDQVGNKLNVILLVSDTFRADNLAAYGSQWIETPHLNRLAEQSVVFEDFYPEGLPTIPVRRTLWTGRRIIPFRYYYQHEPVQLPGWHHLFHEDVTLAEVLTQAGYATALIADLPHLQRPGRNFHRGYRYWDWIRGQEVDFYALAPRQHPDYSGLFPADYLAQPEFNQESSSGFNEFLRQYTANRRRWLEDADSLAELTAKRAVAWLKEYHSEGPFFLHVEAFDPHEPWDPPEYFLQKYLKQNTRPSWPEPPYANIKVPPDGVARFRANYAAEASNLDYWFGKILETASELGLLENTVVVFMSDHGTLLGEQGQFLKGPERLRTQVTHIPLFVRLPGGKRAGQRVKGYVQITDIVPTILGRLDLNAPSRVTGEDVWAYVESQRNNQRDHVVSAFGWVASVRTPEWNYSAVWNKEKYKGSYQPQLYDTRKDPEELKNVASEHPSVVAELHAKLENYIASGWEMTKGSFHGGIAG